MMVVGTHWSSLYEPLGGWCYHSTLNEVRGQCHTISIESADYPICRSVLAKVVVHAIHLAVICARRLVYREGV